MIQAAFRRNRQGLLAASVSGHADFGPHGEDIVCASVTSAVQMAANGITEVLRVTARVKVEENEITIALPDSPDHVSMAFLQALHLHLTLLQQEYPQHIKVTVLEV